MLHPKPFHALDDCLGRILVVALSIRVLDT